VVFFYLLPRLRHENMFKLERLLNVATLQRVARKRLSSRDSGNARPRVHTMCFQIQLAPKRAFTA
jgi:hypothetical protein